MKWLSDQLVFKSKNNFPVNPYDEFPANKKNNNKKEANKNLGQNLNNSEQSLGTSTNTNTNNQNTIGNINSSVS